MNKSCGLALAIAFLSLHANVLASTFSTTAVMQWDSIRESDWIAADDSLAAKHGAVMLFDKVTVDDAAKSDLRTIITLYQRIRIVSAQGHSAADISVPYFYRSQKVKSIAGRTIRHNGDTVLLQPEQIIEKETFKSREVKIKTVSFSMPGVSDDCIVEYCICLELPYGYDTWLAQRSIPLLHGTLDWKLSTSGSKSAVDWGWFRLALAPNWVALNLRRSIHTEKLPSVKDTKELVFSIDSIPALEREPFTLPDKAIAGQVRLYYGSTDSPDAFWGQFATAVPGWADVYLNKTKETKKQAVLFGSLPTQREKIESAFAWVRHRLKNTSFMNDDDTMPQNRGRITAQDAFKKGYADREGINYIFYDLLREMNVDAKIVWVEDRDEDIFVPEVKSWQFGHPLIAVPDSGNQYTFYSPGDIFLTPGGVPWYNEGTSALIGEAMRTSFVAIPFSPSSKNKVNRQITLTLNDDLEPTATAAERYVGHDARRCRLRVNRAAETEKADVLKDQLKNLFDEVEIDSVRYENADSTQLPFRLSYQLRFPSLEGSVVGSRLLLKPLQFLEKAENPFVTHERQNAIVLDFAHETDDILTIQLPEEWEVVGLPPDTAVANDYGSCDVHFVAQPNAVSVHRTLAVNSPFWPATEYAVAQQLFQGYAGLSGLTLTLERKSK